MVGYNCSIQIFGDWPQGGNNGSKSVTIFLFSLMEIKFLKDLQVGMKMLGLNPSDQELIDIPLRFSHNGFIYYADFCQLCLEYFRQEPDQEEDFRRSLFKVNFQIILTSVAILLKVLCGTDPLPTDYRAKKYKVERRHLKKVDNHCIQYHLFY